jgi:hypothetical protein
MEASSSLRAYVRVGAEFTEDGIMLPRYLIWEDGQKYEIDRVKYIGQAASLKAGGQGDCYTIMIQGQERKLFFERSPSLSGMVVGKWFVERARPPKQTHYSPDYGT